MADNSKGEAKRTSPCFPIEEGNIQFPENNIVKCPNCKTEIDLTDTRRQIEAQTGKKIA